MEQNKLDQLLIDYHKFCLSLIDKIPKEEIKDDIFIQEAFKFRDDLENAVLKLQILNKESGKFYLNNEIEILKQKIKDKEQS
jgi:hypothetical protein